MEALNDDGARHFGTGPPLFQTLLELAQSR
jgi:hypothetical protein